MQRMTDATVLQMPPLPDAIDPVEFVRTEGFTEDYEAYVRTITNPNGRGNAAYNITHEKEMLPQDKLVRERNIVHGNCGISREFLWASGRQDGWVQLDLPDESITEERKAEHRALKLKLEERYGQGKRVSKAA